jgi:di/tricarboxylate transporter
MLALILTGVVSVEEGLAGFSNPATITVAFMFILSAALLKTGALQYVTHGLTGVFQRSPRLGLILMMATVALISAFVNNTPVVAVFIPVVIQIARSADISPSRLLIPLSFASIMGGMCTLLGTSTNLLVNGIALQQGVPEIGIFEMSLVGAVLLVIGLVYMTLFSSKILPSNDLDQSLETRFGMRDYLTDIQILEGSKLEGVKIMDSTLVRELEMDILEISRGGNNFTLPPGDFELAANDVLKTRCNADKIRALKDQAKIVADADVKIGDHNLNEDNSTIVEIVITSNSGIEGQTLKEADFRRRYRAAPLAILHREEVQHENLYDVELRAGDVILAEVKSHFIPQLKQMETGPEAPFAIISEEQIGDFDRSGFWKTLALVAIMVVLAATNLISIAAAAIAAVLVLVLMGQINMKEAYDAVNWKIVFVLAGVLSLGVAMQNSGLNEVIATGIMENLGSLGPIAVLSGIYLCTSVLTELMSNTVTAALMAPIAIAAATAMGVNTTPFLIAVMFASSASFMTPIGYQTNTMVYSAGHYKFTDFIKVGTALNIIFWLVASFLIPLVYGF